MNNAIDKQAFRNGMAMLGGAVSIITSAGASGRVGMTASAVCSVTDTPPTLLVWFNRDYHQLAPVTLRQP